MPNEPRDEWWVETRLVHPTQGFSGRRRLRVGEEALILLEEREERGLRIPCRVIHGLRQGADTVELIVVGGSVTLCVDDDVEGCGRAVSEAVAPFPAFATRLARYGSPRAGDPGGQERFFGPIFSARNRALRADPILPRISAFRADVVKAAYERFPDEIVGTLPPGATRRARIARVHDALEPVMTAIAEVARTGESALSGGEANSVASWRTWTAAVAQLLGALDASWRQIARDTPEKVRP